jgi:hypothetical protein
MAFLERLRRNYFGKIIFFKNFLYIAETYFRVFFLQDRYILETYFLTIKRFWKAAYKTTQFLSRFCKLFYNNNRGFRKYMMLRERTKAPWTMESGRKIYEKVSEKNA